MIVFLYRNDETEMETERTVTGWLPSLGGRRKDERASRKDILSALVRLWPVLCYMSLVAHLRREHMFLTSPFFSDHPLCLTTDPTQADTERRSDTCFSRLQGRWPAREAHAAQYLLSLMKLQDGRFGDEITGCRNYTSWLYELCVCKWTKKRGLVLF